MSNFTTVCQFNKNVKNKKNRRFNKLLFFCSFFFLGLIFPFNKLDAQLITEQFNYTASAVDGLAKQSSSLWTIVNSGDSVLDTPSK